MADVDGVLTDGGMYYTDKGDLMKKFFTRDGMGVALLRRRNIPTILVTKERTKIVKQWAKKMKIDRLYDGVAQKELILDVVCKKYKIKPQEVSFIGDDINDIPLLKLAGFSVTPFDGIKEAKYACDYVCNAKGGNGAFRELVDLILQAKSLTKA